MSSPEPSISLSSSPQPRDRDVSVKRERSANNNREDSLQKRVKRDKYNKQAEVSIQTTEDRFDHKSNGNVVCERCGDYEEVVYGHVGIFCFLKF